MFGAIIEEDDVGDGGNGDVSKRVGNGRVSLDGRCVLIYTE